MGEGERGSKGPLGTWREDEEEALQTEGGSRGEGEEDRREEKRVDEIRI